MCRPWSGLGGGRAQLAVDREAEWPPCSLPTRREGTRRGSMQKAGGAHAAITGLYFAGVALRTHAPRLFPVADDAAWHDPRLTRRQQSRDRSAMRRKANPRNRPSPKAPAPLEALRIFGKKEKRPEYKSSLSLDSIRTGLPAFYSGTPPLGTLPGVFNEVSSLSVPQGQEKWGPLDNL